MGAIIIVSLTFSFLLIHGLVTTVISKRKQKKLSK
jgi:hypothetical protein